MYDMSISIIIPSRNEPYLSHTIKDLLAKAKGEIEIIAVLDGYWPPINEIVDDKRVKYIHFSQARGMRNALNSAVSIATGTYILKTDAHCMFSEGYDVELAKNCEYDWVVVPRRYALDVKNWKIEERSDDKYPIDHMYLSNDLHGVVWKEKNIESRQNNEPLEETMSSQGSVWFMKRTYFDWLGLMDEETYGTFWNEFQEIGLKAWLSGGKVMVNKEVWYAHWHKTEGRGYSLQKGEQEQVQKTVERWLTEKMFKKQRHDIKWLVNKFAPVPGW